MGQGRLGEAGGEARERDRLHTRRATSGDGEAWQTAAVATEGPFGRRGTRYHPRGLRGEQRVATMREGV